MDENAEKITEKLKELIDQNGLDYLKDEPYEVYQELPHKKKTEKKAATMVLYALTNDIQSIVKPGCDPSSLSKKIQSICSLNKAAADYLSEIFLALYSKENENEWNEKNLEGLSQFLSEKFVCSWDGRSSWAYGGYGEPVDCYYKAKIVLKPIKGAIPDERLAELLKKNPFMTKESIGQYYAEYLRSDLDDEFEYYCTAEKYYPPGSENFEAEYYASEWCKKHGFKLVSCKGDGYDDF